MTTAHEIVRKYSTLHNIAWPEFTEWFSDRGYPEEEANVHDSRLMMHLEAYVEERDEHNDVT